MFSIVTVSRERIILSNHVVSRTKAAEQTELSRLLLMTLQKFRTFMTILPIMSSRNLPLKVVTSFENET